MCKPDFLCVTHNILTTHIFDAMMLTYYFANCYVSIHVYIFGALRFMWNEKKKDIHTFYH